jgi:hypothetical protein
MITRRAGGLRDEGTDGSGSHLTASSVRFLCNLPHDGARHD